MVVFDGYLYKDVCDALDRKKDYEVYMRYLCDKLGRMSPGDNRWYFNSTGFLQVDVCREDYDAYLDFVFELVGCKHCYLMNKSGFTLMFSLGALKSSLEDLRGDF